jgi:hypothetical protein
MLHYTESELVHTVTTSKYRVNVAHIGKIIVSYVVYPCVNIPFTKSMNTVSTPEGFECIMEQVDGNTGY